jgi:hypothetical protein
MHWNEMKQKEAKLISFSLRNALEQNEAKRSDKIRSFVLLQREKLKAKKV